MKSMIKYMIRLIKDCWDITTYAFTEIGEGWLILVLQLSYGWTITLVVNSIIATLLAFPVKWCWNTVIPCLGSFPDITWVKAWCLIFLATILFKPNTTTINK